MIGASFGPVCGAMMADYFLAGRKWSGPRAGFNPAGWISWIVGFVVGAFNLVAPLLSIEMGLGREATCLTALKGDMFPCRRWPRLSSALRSTSRFSVSVFARGTPHAGNCGIGLAPKIFFFIYFFLSPLPLGEGPGVRAAAAAACGFVFVEVTAWACAKQMRPHIDGPVPGDVLPARTGLFRLRRSASLPAALSPDAAGAHHGRRRLPAVLLGITSHPSDKAPILNQCEWIRL